MKDHQHLFTTYDQAIRKLANHANQPMDDADSENESYILTLWKMSKQREPLDFVPKLDDIIECLEVINIKLNGCTPSETKIFDSSVDSELARKINYLVVGGMEHALHWQTQSIFGQEIIRQGFLCSWKIAKGWEAILEGDIDCIREHLEHESVARELNP